MVKKGCFIVSELNYNPTQGETTSIFGYRQKFGSSEMIATINSKGKISTVLNIFG